MISIKTNGFDKILKDFKRFEKEGQQVVSGVVYTTSLEVVAEAKRNAPVDTGKLKQNIISQKIEDLVHLVSSLAPYSAYMEFGTGREVDVPSEFKEIAEQYRGKGIKRIHLLPQPFMFPALLKGRRIFTKDLKAQLNRLIKKYE